MGEGEREPERAVFGESLSLAPLKGKPGVEARED